MKKYLPAFIITFLIVHFFLVKPLFAQVPTVTPVPQTFTDTSTLCQDTPDGEWCPYPDKDVTFYGKAAVRAKDFLDITLRNPQWSVLTGTTNALASFWVQIRNIMYAFFVLLVLVTAFILIITRGRSITAMRFIPRSIIILLLVAFSFALVQFIYQITDVVQGFFLVKDGTTLSSADLLNIAFKYNDFIGFRKAGVTYDEAVFTSLLLVKLTTVTYYVMAGLLLFRKIILWFFIVVSPIFPLLLLYAPIRNTAKIWTGEFFRWLLYGPIFAILLSGLVSLWRASIPINFAANANANSYLVAVSILIGAPGQIVDLDHSLNTPESFGLYIVALLMLWTVIFLPFILLQIFLDYFHSAGLSDNVFIQQLLAKSSLATSTSSQTTTNTASAISTTGIAKAFPFVNRFFASVTAPTTPTVSLPPVKETVSKETVISKTFQSKEPASTPAVRISEIRETRPQMQTSINNIPSVKIPPATTTVSVKSSSMQQPFTRTRVEVSPTSPTIAQRFETITKSSTVIPSPSEESPLNGATSEVSLPSAKLVIPSMQTSSVPIATQTSAAPPAARIPTKEPLPGFTRPIYQEKPQIPHPDKDIAQRANAPTLNRSNLLIPTIKEVAGFDTATITSDIQTHQQIAKTHETLESIANPNIIMQPTSRNEFTKVQDELVKEKQKGNPVASAVLSAAASVSHTKLPSGQRAGVQIQDTAILLPTSNRVQAVKPQEYEEVKKMWEGNYTKLAPPRDLHGVQKSRNEWIVKDIEKITHTIELLKANDPQKNKEGMTLIGNILPFLLIGGFSREEIIKYLEAKLAAARNASGKLQSDESEKQPQQSQSPVPPNEDNKNKPA